MAVIPSPDRLPAGRRVRTTATGAHLPISARASGTRVVTGRIQADVRFPAECGMTGNDAQERRDCLHGVISQWMGNMAVTMQEELRQWVSRQEKINFEWYAS